MSLSYIWTPSFWMVKALIRCWPFYSSNIRGSHVQDGVDGMLVNLFWVKSKSLDQSEIAGDQTGKTSWDQIIHGLQNQVKGFELNLANKKIFKKWKWLIWNYFSEWKGGVKVLRWNFAVVPVSSNMVFRRLMERRQKSTMRKVLKVIWQLIICGKRSEGEHK